jgi:FMN phosphatase YigB (HAD superfamily)
MPETPKIIVFDIGGVLLDWKALIPVIADKLKITLDQFHSELQKPLKDLELGKKHQDEFWKYLCDKYNYGGEYQDLKKIWIEEQPLIDSGWSVLKESIESGYKVACCTNNWIGTLERQVEIIPDFSLFKIVINSAYEGARKPDEEIYRIVESSVGEKGKDVLLIDDSEENCKGAEKLGWETFQFDCTINKGMGSARAVLDLLKP